MQTLEEFRADFRSEVGDAAQLAENPEIDRWFNAAQRKLGVYRPQTDTITWAAGATTVALPADFHHVEEFVPDDGTYALPAHRVWAGQLAFNRAATSAGSGTLRYWATWPKVTGSQRSLLTQEADDVCLSYALYRFFKRLASSRSDYRRYSTITGSNGVDISELDALSERHYNDFTIGAQDLIDSSPEIASFYDD